MLPYMQSLVVCFLPTALGGIRTTTATHADYFPNEQAFLLFDRLIGFIWQNILYISINSADYILNLNKKCSPTILDM